MFICCIYLRQKQITKLQQYSHSQLAVSNFFGFDRETTSNEYVSIDEFQKKVSMRTVPVLEITKLAGG